MTQSGRRALRKGLLLAILVLGAAIAGLRTPQAADSACTLARRELPALLGLDVGIGSCELDPISQTVKLRGVSLFEPGAETPLIAADEAEVSVGAVQPLLGQVELDSIRLVRPRISLDLTRPRAEKGTQQDCSLDVLRRLEITRLEIRNAEVRIALPEGRAVELLGGDVTWRRRRGRAEIRLQATRGRVLPRADVELEMSALAVDARFDADSERVEITRAELAVDGLSVTASGDIQQLCEPELALEASVFVPMTTVAKAAGLEEKVTGHLWTLLAVDGPAAKPTVTLDVAGSELSVGRYAPGGFDARATLNGDTLRIEQLETSAGDGVLQAKGSVTFGERVSLALEVDARDAEFGPALAKAGLPGSWVDFPATGRARIAGHVYPQLHLEGPLDLEAGRFRLASAAYDAPSSSAEMILEFERARASGHVVILPDRTELLGVKIASNNSEVVGDATLWYAQEKGMRVKGEAVHVDLSDFGHLSGVKWSGTGTGTFEVKGPYDRIAASAAVSLRDFDYWKMSLGVVQARLEWAGDKLVFPSATGQKGRTQYFGSAELTFPKDGPFWSRGNVYVVDGRLEDVVDVLMPMHENMDHFQGTLEGNVSGTIAVDCPSDAFAGTVDLQIQEMKYFDRRVGDGRMVLRFEDGDQAILEPTLFKGPLGTTEVAGTWDFDGPLDYRFKIQGALAEVVGPERAQEAGLEGDLSLVGRVGGDTTVWTVSMWLTSPSIRFAGKNLGATKLEGRMQGRDLQVWGRPFDGATMNMKMRVKDPYPWELTAKLSLPEIQPLLPAPAIAQGVSGSISGSVEAVGNLRDGKSVEGAATIDKLTLVRGDFSGENDGRIEVSWRAGRITVEQFRFRGPNTELSVAGAAGPKTLDMNLHGSLDMRLLESFVPQLERTTGMVELTAAAAGGTLQAPTLAGTATVRDARLTLRDMPVTVRGLSGRVEFSEARVLVQDLRGVLNDGRVEVEGDIRLDRFQPRSLQLRMQVDEVSLRLVEYLPFTATGELNLAGKPDALTLSGDVDIVRLRYDQPLVLESLLTDLRSARVGGASSGQPKKDWLTFDVAIHARGDVRVENNLAKARLRGDLRLTGTNLSPGLLGTIEAMDGAEIYFRGNTFNVSQALVEFKDRREIDPVFDLHAQTQVREYAVNLHSFGRIKDPQVILSSDPDLPEADILSLLTLGVTSRDQSDAVATGVNVFGEALFSYSGLDRQVQRFLPKNPLLRDLSFHISSGYNEASGAVEPMAHFESKFLTERLALDMTQPMVSSKGTRARAEYRFDDRLSGQLQWDNERSEDLPNFGVDLKLRWEVE